MVTQPETSTLVNVNDFRKPVLPDLASLAQAIGEALQHFNECSALDLKDTFLETHVKSLIEQGHYFRKLAQDSGEAGLNMAKYTCDILEYFDIMTGEEVLSDDFLEALKSLAELAVENKIKASTLKTSFCNILVELKNLSSQIVDFTIDLGVQKEVEDALEQDAHVLRKNQAATTWAAVGTGIGTGLAIAAAPFTAGASLAVIGALGVGSAGAMIGTTISSVVNGERAKLSEDELKRLRVNRINPEINFITEQLKVITVDLDRLEQFWAEQVNEIAEISEKYNSIGPQTHFKMTRMKGTMMKKQWTSVKDDIESYKNNIFNSIRSECY